MIRLLKRLARWFSKGLQLRFLRRTLQRLGKRLDDVTEDVHSLQDFIFRHSNNARMLERVEAAQEHLRRLQKEQVEIGREINRITQEILDLTIP